MPVQFNHWAVARNANTMGVVTQMSIDPNQITPRIKSKVKQWLTTGYIEGGYRSEAAKLCNLIRDSFDLECVHTWWGSMVIQCHSSEMAHKIVELIDADVALIALEKPGHAGFYRDLHGGARMSLLEGAPSVPCHFYYGQFRKQAAQAVMQFASAEQREKLQQAVDAITGDIPVTLNSIDRWS